MIIITHYLGDSAQWLTEGEEVFAGFSRMKATGYLWRGVFWLSKTRNYFDIIISYQRYKRGFFVSEFTENNIPNLALRNIRDAF